MKTVERKINELIPADYNPRTLTEKQFGDLKQSLKEFGFVEPVVVNINPERKDIIIGGHQRVKVWQSMGNETVPTVEVNLTLEKEKELNIRLNKNTGSFDFEILANEFDIDELKSWGFEDWEFGIGESEEEEKKEDEKLKCYDVIISCKTEDEQDKAMEELKKLGFDAERK